MRKSSVGSKKWRCIANNYKMKRVIICVGYCVGKLYVNHSIVESFWPRQKIYKNLTEDVHISESNLHVYIRITVGDGGLEDSELELLSCHLQF